MTTKKIAERQNITEPAIYKQYNSKKEIIFGILERYSNFDQSINNTIIEQKLNCWEGVKYYFYAYAEYYQNYNQMATVMLSYELFNYDIDIRLKMKKIIDRKQEFFNSFIEKGKSLNQFVGDVPSPDAADFLLGVLWSTTYFWKLNKCDFSLKEKLINHLEKSVKHWFITK
jgi:AcrR family transcriptional regulator